jgi:hypothetical protein
MHRDTHRPRVVTVPREIIFALAPDIAGEMHFVTHIDTDAYIAGRDLMVPPLAPSHTGARSLPLPEKK